MTTPNEIHKRFLAGVKVSETTGCWEWQREKSKSGYGRISINGKNIRTHRYSYAYYNGEIGDLHVLHKCDNRCCCNPDHLFLGNPIENSLDMLRKGRCRVAKLTIDDIFTIRKLASEGVERKEISARLGFTRKTVDNVVTGNRWAHLTEENRKSYKNKINE